mgnify:CR=1 FL=1
MDELILYFIFLLFASYFLLKITIFTLKYFNFISKPTNRGLHVSPVTTSGGAYFVFYLIVLFFHFNENLFNNNLLEIIFLLLFTIFFGMMDDKMNFKRTNKLVIQFTLSLILISLFNFDLSQSLFPLIQIDTFYFFLNLIFLIAFINFINFIDGSDGNLILFVFFIFFCLITKLYFNQLIFNYVYLVYFIPFIIIFYLFNIQKKIFLGDSGSIFLSIFLILNLNYFVDKEVIKIYDVLIISSYFIVDMFITFCLRIYYYGFNSFKAHRDHAYQNYCLINKNHKKLNLYFSIYNFLYLFPLYLLFVNDLITSLIALLSCLIPATIFVVKYSPLVKINNDK